ncbi:MAG: hypothetical protein Q8J84_01520 [Flavobacteriaceae bacterium]|nr:hypothetical protein [Flavobacteriaceae bacterium]
MNEQLNLFVESAKSFLNEIAVFLPKVIGAIIILIIGWILAKLIKKLTIKLLTLVKFDFLTDKSGIEKFIKDGGVKYSSIELIGTFFYWIFMFVVIMAVLNSLGLNKASELFYMILSYIPNVIVAIAIFIIGMYLADLVSQMLLASLTSMQEKIAKLVSRIAFYSIILLTIFITLVQLNIAEEIVVSAFQILFGAICLAFALSFGLGGKSKAEDFLNEFFKK